MKCRALLVTSAFSLVLLAVGCGGGGSSPSSPSTGGSPSSGGSASPTVVTSGVFTFTFPVGTSSTDQSTIQDNVAYANTFFQSTFGHGIQNATAIQASSTDPACAQGGAAAATTSGKIIFCTSNAGWIQPGAKNDQKIVMHELFHVFQFEEKWLGGSNAGPDWIIEGSAELVGFRAAAQKGLFSSSDLIGCMTKQVSDFASQHPPGLSLNLQAYENQAVFSTTQGPLYPLSFLGMDDLVGANLSLLKSYGDALGGGTIYNDAFKNTFTHGQLIQFYADADFPAYERSLPVPASFNCGG